MSFTIKFLGLAFMGVSILKGGFKETASWTLSFLFIILFSFLLTFFLPYPYWALIQDEEGKSGRIQMMKGIKKNDFLQIMGKFENK